MKGKFNITFAKMSTKICQKYLFVLIFLLFSEISFADVGYEEKSNDMIDTLKSIYEIDIGDDISYYDFRAENYKNGFVAFKDYTTAGIKIEVNEIETKEKKVFFIDYDD